MINREGIVAIVILSLAWLAASAPVRAQAELVLENSRVGLSFDRTTGTLAVIQNRLTGESYQVSGDKFALEAVEFRLDFADARLTSLKQQGGTLSAQYKGGGTTIHVTYTLVPGGHFAEKRIAVTCNRPFGLKKMVLSRPTFSAADLRLISYRFPKFRRKPGEEPNCAFFGRTPKGGFFAGVEVPFDGSSLSGPQITLCYSPSLKVAAGEELVSEPAYFGVYSRQARDQEESDLPLQSESDAMVAMTSAILGPPRFGLVPMVNGWHSEMEHRTYTESSVAGDMKSLDFVAECGFDWIGDSHPWGGETAKMNLLGASDKYVPGPLVRTFLEHARKVGVKVAMGPTMNMTHPFERWAKIKAGGEVKDLSAPLRADRQDWRMQPSPVFRCVGNCIGNKPFLDWLTRVNLEGLATGYYKSWCMDGDFSGYDLASIVPVKCASDQHDHLPGDSNYACQRALAELTASVRKHYPDTYIFMCRPPMDLGIWALRNVDVCFTLLESGTGGSNLAGGDSIRTWSRTRVHRDFLPHYLDQPLMFPSHQEGQRDWTRGHLDYILLSAISSSPNQHYYMPTKTGIPAEDKAEIRKWLDWGRKNIAYLKVRKDLPDWLAPGRVDGSAHIVGDRGLVLLFHSGETPSTGEFSLTEESIGLRGKGPFRVTQEYPPSDRSVRATFGQAIRWDVPARTAMILRVQPWE
jgi:hypothetical protein